MQLADAWLSSVEFRDNQQYDFDQDRAVTYGVTPVTTVDLDSPGGPYAELHVTIHWTDEEEEPTPGPFHLELTVTGQFEGDLGFDRQALGQWLDFNSQFLLWPYARSYAAAVTALSNRPALTLFTLYLPRPRAFEPETGEFGVTDPRS